MQGSRGNYVVVPTSPGPIERVPTDGERPRDDIDELLDDVFGEPDEAGPGRADAALVGGGVLVAVVGAWASLPGAVAVVGAVAAGLGLVLPARWVWRSTKRRRRHAAASRQLAGGLPLQVDHPAVEQLVERHDRLIAAAGHLDGASRLQVATVAHHAVYEAASLLGGRAPSSPDEVDYVATRTSALDHLLVAVADPAAGRHDEIDARLAARRDVERLGGSSISEADELARRLGGEPGG